MASQAGGVNQAGLDILGIQPRITLQDGGRIIARREHVEHMLHRQAAATDDRFAAEDFRIEGDASNELFLIQD